MDKKSLIYTLATVVEETFQTKEPAISVASVLEAMSSVASYLCDGCSMMHTNCLWNSRCFGDV